MKAFHRIGLFGLMMTMVVSMLAGCGGARLVQQTTSKSDSTNAQSKSESIKNDSSSYVEKATKKTIPASSVEATYSPAQIDSLKKGLQAMPKGTVIYKTDPKMQTTLSATLDELGNLRIKCASNEQTYYETSITQSRLIEKSKTEITEKDRIIREMDEKIKQYEASWFVKVGRFLENEIWFILIIASVGAVLYILIRLKKIAL